MITLLNQSVQSLQNAAKKEDEYTRKFIEIRDIRESQVKMLLSSYYRFDKIVDHSLNEVVYYIGRDITGLISGSNELNFNKYNRLFKKHINTVRNRIAVSSSPDNDTIVESLNQLDKRFTDTYDLLLKYYNMSLQYTFLSEEIKHVNCRHI